MRIAIETLGCKLNQAETETMTRQFLQVGHELVARPDRADVYILNTCTVTRAADAKSRHLLRLAHRRNPNVVIIATGCYAQRDSSAIKDIEGVTYVIGNDRKTNLSKILQSITQKPTQ